MAGPDSEDDNPLLKMADLLDEVRFLRGEIVELGAMLPSGYKPEDEENEVLASLAALRKLLEPTMRTMRKPVKPSVVTARTTSAFPTTWTTTPVREGEMIISKSDLTDVKIKSMSEMLSRMTASMEKMTDATSGAMEGFNPLHVLLDESAEFDYEVDGDED